MELRDLGWFSIQDNSKTVDELINESDNRMDEEKKLNKKANF